MGQLLTPGEYDDLPDQCKIDLQLVVQQPTHNIHSDEYRRRFGGFMNGEIGYDYLPWQKVGYGTGSRFAPPVPPIPRSTTPKVSIKPGMRRKRRNAK